MRLCVVAPGNSARLCVCGGVYMTVASTFVCDLHVSDPVWVTICTCVCVMVCESVSIAVWWVYVSMYMLDCLCLSVIWQQGNYPLTVYMAPSGIVSSVYMQL